MSREQLVLPARIRIWIEKAILWIYCGGTNPIDITYVWTKIDLLHIRAMEEMEFIAGQDLGIEMYKDEAFDEFELGNLMICKSDEVPESWPCSSIMVDD